MKAGISLADITRSATDHYTWQGKRLLTSTAKLVIVVGTTEQIREGLHGGCIESWYSNRGEDNVAMTPEQFEDDVLDRHLSWTTDEDMESVTEGTFQLVLV